MKRHAFSCLFTFQEDYVSGFFFFQAEDGIRDLTVTGVQTCALPISRHAARQRRPDGRCDRTPPPLRGVGRAVAGRRAPDRPAAAAAPLGPLARRSFRDRKSVVEGKRVDLGGRRIIKKKNKNKNRTLA